MKKYYVEIEGNDNFYTNTTVIAEDFDACVVMVKNFMVKLEGATIEKLRITLIEEQS